ncbi:MAG: SdpI family protein [Tissierellia bacterium]|nr:SdpI family protein [Tissierellia bacterium]MDD4780289.1 SdpI family protein [Tissierellia bacterium]
MNKIFNHENIKVWIIFVVTLIVAIFSYGYLPDQIPIHFNVAGEIDNYGGKIYIFLFPAIIIMMILLAEFARNTDPKKSSYSKFKKEYYLIFLLVSILMFLIELYTIAVSMNMKVFNINMLMPGAVGLMFVIIGNSMPKFKQNFYAGIRTSWTLADEEVWFKTHRLGGKVWFIGGLLMMLTAFMPDTLKAIIFFGTVLVLVFVPFIYSYVIYNNKYK